MSKLLLPGDIEDKRRLYEYLKTKEEEVAKLRAELEAEKKKPVVLEGTHYRTISQQLSARGQYALPLDGLMGRAGQAQYCYIPVVDELPSPMHTPYEVVILDGATDKIYVLDRDGSAYQWTEISLGGGGGGAPANATFIVQTADATLTNEQALSALATGILKNTTGTGVLSIAAAGTDYAAATGATTAILKGNGAGGFSDAVSNTDYAAATHASRHQSGGADAIKLDDLATPDDNTDLDASTTRHGLLPKLPNDPLKYLDGDGNFTSPADIDSRIRRSFFSITVLGTASTTPDYIGVAGGSFTAASRTGERVNGKVWIKMNSSTLINGQCTFTSAANVAGFDLNPDMVVMYRTGSDAAALAGRLFIVLSDGDPAGSDTPAIDIAGFRYSSATDGTAFWRAINGTGGSYTTTATSVAVAVDTDYLFRVYRVSSSEIRFYIDNTLVATHTTNVPTATNTEPRIVGVNVTSGVGTEVSHLWSRITCWYS